MILYCTVRHSQGSVSIASWTLTGQAGLNLNTILQWNNKYNLLVCLMLISYPPNGLCCDTSISALTVLLSHRSTTEGSPGRPWYRSVQTDQIVSRTAPLSRNKAYLQSSSSTLDASLLQDTRIKQMPRYLKVQSTVAVLYDKVRR